jgi:hypothetical protein
MTIYLHITPILPTDFEQRVGDLAKGTMAHRVYEFGKNIFIVDCGLAHALKRVGAGIGVGLLKLV